MLLCQSGGVSGWLSLGVRWWMKFILDDWEVFYCLGLWG